GQGDTRYNALELANYVAAIANGGTVYRPYLVDKIVDPTGQVVRERGPIILNQADVSPSTLEIVRKGMFQVTQPPDGTAISHFVNMPRVAAKTGTAEVTGKDNHALVVGYAPYDDPEIAVAVIMEFAGRGGAMAGPVVSSIFRAYFEINGS
ncbi:MAG: penicillin-binding transpeptidase domain-containing protein, partial [Peptococcaceae bacterium]|nr:penicillin-binding transpeptidase domain-containing protein [Peptococcaceae bacterium]